ncbi:hypothetical protein BKA70DRAFT_1221951 [Coprinopsis sp. MPI-PUGE-AT-0042]|nr:hypothetical protein BKA70DRAFT_1221951 [Coprinopsis sp. MPI-PUGE-AT-0042]
MDEHHDDHPIDPAVIEDLQQFLRNFKHKTTQPKMKKEILAKIEEHLSVLARLKDEEGLDSTFHVLLCSLSVVILENFPMYAVIDWVEKGNDDWEDDSPWDSFFLMPPYGFPAYVAPNRSANIRLPSSRWIVVRSPLVVFVLTLTIFTNTPGEFAQARLDPFSILSIPPIPKANKTKTKPLSLEARLLLHRAAPRRLQLLQQGLDPPSSSKKNRKSVEDMERALSKDSATSPTLASVASNSPASGQRASSRLAKAKTPNSSFESPGPARGPVGTHTQTRTSKSRTTLGRGTASRSASSSKSVPMAVIKTKDSLEGERPRKRPRMGLYGPVVIKDSDDSPSSSDEDEGLDELDEDDDDEELYTPRQTRAMHLKSKNGGVTLKQEKEDAAPMPPSPVVKKGSRKRKDRKDDDNADVDDDAPEGRASKKTRKTKRRKGKKRDETPELPAIYDSKGQRILVAPYVDSLPSALLQVSDPMFEELEGELVVAPCSRCALTGKECETQGFDRRCIVCKRGRQPCDLEFTAVRRPRRVTASAGYQRYEYASANLSQLATDMEGEIASARVLLAMAHAHAQQAKTKKDLIGSIVHRLIANTSEQHATEEIFGGRDEAFQKFKRVFFEPLPFIGAGSFNMAQLLAAAKELSLVEFYDAASDNAQNAEHRDIVKDAAASSVSRAASPVTAPDDEDAAMGA